LSQRPSDICFGVGPGWWPILRDLHTELLDWDADYRFVAAEERHGATQLYIDWSQVTIARLSVRANA
jgi:hypothetical protein